MMNNNAGRLKIAHLNSRALQALKEMKETDKKQTSSEPSSKLSHAQKESKSEKKTRIAKAKAEAYGPNPSRKTNTTTLDNILSTRFGREKQTVLFHDELKPIFEASRSFCGKLSFEIKLGQILVPTHPKLTDEPLHTIKNWAALFRPSRSAQILLHTYFTKSLTSNGSDIDRALEMKLKETGCSSKLWAEAEPNATLVEYHFLCVDKNDNCFCIVMDQNGSSELRKRKTKIGAVNLHFPGQVWDACAVLDGFESWIRPPESITRAMMELIDSVSVIFNQSRICVLFQRPQAVFAVSEFQVHRKSQHKCLISKLEDFDLQVTEVKNLHIQPHPRDKTIYHATETGDLEMKHDDRIHYEMSLTHDPMNAKLAENQCIEVGELSDKHTTGQALLNADILGKMLDLAVYVVEHIDYIGSQNIGTLQRVEADHRDMFHQTPTTSSPTKVHLPKSSTQPSSTIGDTKSLQTGQITNSFIPGMRTNTVAKIFTAVDGSKYALGLGGARILVVGSELNIQSKESVCPDDSISRAGLSTTTKKERKPWQPSADDREAGYW